MFRIVGN